MSLHPDNPLATINHIWKGVRHDGTLIVFTSSSSNIPEGVVLCHFTAHDIEFTMGIDMIPLRDSGAPDYVTCILENFDSYYYSLMMNIKEQGVKNGTIVIQ